jgi:hygromycin-B 7''-O-kinase
VEIVVRTKEEWGRVFTRIETWRPLVEEICRRHGLANPGGVRAGYPGTHAVFVVDEAVVVKIAAPFWRDDFMREQELYRLLAGRADLLAPRLLAHGVIGAGQEWPYFIMQKMPGLRIGEVWEEIPPRNRIEIAERLGAMVRVLHDFPLSEIQWLDSSAAAWERFVHGQIAGCVEHHRRQGSLPAHLLEQLPLFLSEAAVLPAADFTPSLLNCDITEDHVLLSPDGSRWVITGLIDYGDAQAGDPYYEWVALGLGALAGVRNLLRCFLSSYGWEPADAGFSRRMLAWTLLHRFSDMRPHLERLGGAERVRRLEELQEALWAR